MNDVAMCPECRQYVRVPEASTPCQLRCPECSARFPLEAILSVTIPTLIVENESALASAAPADAAREDQPSTVPEEDVTEAAKSPERQFDEPAPLETESVEIDVGTRHSAQESSTPIRAVDTASSSSTRRSRSPLIEVAKIALGGFAGLIIAQLILWWLPGDLRRDPFNVAPYLPPAMRFILPNELRPAALTPANKSPHQQGDASSDPSAATVDAYQITAAHEAATLDRIRLKSPPSYSGEDLERALFEIRSLLQVPTNQNTDAQVTRQTRRERFRQLYQKLCEVSQVVTFVEVGDREIGERMRAAEALLVRIARSPELTSLVEHASEDWIHYPDRSNNGIAIVGQVLNVTAAPGIYGSRIRLSGDSKSTVLVLSPIDPTFDPRQAYAPGQWVIVLGSLISDPSVQLGEAFRQALSPDDETVIWQGLHQRVDLHSNGR